MTDPFNHSSSSTYYDDGRLQTFTDRNNHVTGWTYTSTGKPDTITYHDNSSVNYSYDIHDRLTGITDSIAGSTSFDHDATGRIISSTDANGFTVTYNYDNAGRVEEVVNFNGSHVLYGYDDANRLTSIQNLTSENAIISSQSFILDGNGNRIQEERTGPVKSAVKLASLPATYIKNRLDTAGGQAVGHDDEGQRASKGGDSYTFDPRHRLTSVAGSGSTIYLYDGASNRIQVDRDGIVKKYIYDIRGNLIAEADENNTITRYYYYGAGLLGFDDLTGVNGATNYSYHFDALGSTIAASDNTEQLVNWYSYSPFGVILQETESIQQPFKYVGQLGVVAEENGLYYMRARYYDPQVGRFISEDPIGFGGGDVNLYVYVKNDPVNRIDPEGLADWHFDRSPSGERLIHKGKYRYNKNGDLVDHSGRKLSKPEKGGSQKEAKKVLDWLKKKKGGFFTPSMPLPLMFEWQEKLIDRPWIDETTPFDQCGNPNPA